MEATESDFCRACSDMTIDWKSYDPGEFYDELISTPGYARAPARNLTAWLRSLSNEDLQALSSTN